MLIVPARRALHELAIRIETGAKRLKQLGLARPACSGDGPEDDWLPTMGNALSDRQGLTTGEALDRLTLDGPNELPSGSRRTAYRIALEVMREPMLAMLLAAGGIYLLLGDKAEALILLAFASLSILITIVQEARTERVLDALRQLAAPRALVIRDGAVVRIPGREVVRDDLLVLEQGDRIAADAVLLQALNLEADESLLTGESVPVRKRAAGINDPDHGEPGGDDLPHIFSGTIVTRGGGLARVTSTGPRSRMGSIGASLASLTVEAPHLQQETARIVRICAIGGVAAALLVVLLYGLQRGSWLDAALFGIATGMSLLPEEFPIVLTIFLAMGAWRIAQVGVLTRRTSAIETMGSTTVLCVDKTGTLTQNRMAVSDLWLPDGQASTLNDENVRETFGSLLEVAMLASAPIPVDPMEIAFHEADRKHGLPGRAAGSLIHSYGLQPDLLAMSNVWQDSNADLPLMIAAKGAPEAIARLCRLDDAARASLEHAAKVMATRGMRVLGIATAQADREALTKAHDEHDFVLAGLIGLSDPLRPNVVDAVSECRTAGIRVIMITGDFAATARAIGEQAGLAEGRLMTGADIAALDDDGLAHAIGDVSIFARTVPEQKLRIVSALKRVGEIVAMTGDGVNDAPALKAAHIGVAMGERGSDVAREAASIVLVRDDFGAIVAAIRLGRRIYDNIRKAVGFIFGVHVPIAGLALLPLVTGLPVVLGPIQIALLEMVIDPVCALVFEAEREESNLMRRPPRHPRERLFSWELVVRSLVQGLVTFGAIGLLYLYLAWQGTPIAQLRTITFLSLIFSILALVLADRAFSTSLRRAFIRGNVTLRYVAIIIALAVILVQTVPWVRDLLQFAPLSPLQFLLSGATGACLLGIFEVIKRLSRREPTAGEHGPEPRTTSAGQAR